MAKFILTEKQMAEVLNHIEKGKKTKKFNEKQLNENGSDKKKYSLEDLESAFNAGRIICQHSDLDVLMKISNIGISKIGLKI